MSIHDRPIWLWLIPTLLLVAALGTYRLNFDVLWGDEFTSLIEVGGLNQTVQSPAQILKVLAEKSPQHMPLYHLLLGEWAALVGWEPFALRALSLLLGLLTVCWTYRLVRDWLSPQVGIYAAVLMGMNAFFIYFTHEMRMYTMLTQFAVWTLWNYRYLTSADKPRGLLAWAGLWIAVVGLLGTHLTGAVILVAVSIFHLIFVRPSRRWLKVWVVLIAAGLVYLPWLQQVVIDAAQKMPAQSGVIEKTLLEPGEIIGSSIYLFSNAASPFLGIVLILALLALLRYWQAAREIWFLAIMALASMLVLNVVFPVIVHTRLRYLLFLWPVLALLAGLGLLTLERLKLRRIALGLVLVIAFSGFMHTFNPGYLAQMDGPRHVIDSMPVNEVVRTISQLADPDDLLVTLSRRNTIFGVTKFGLSIASYYVDYDADLDRIFIEIPKIQEPDQIRNMIFEPAIRHIRIWLASDAIIAPEERTRFTSILEEQFIFCGTYFDGPEYRVDRYDLAPFDCLDEQLDLPMQVTFGEGIVLQGFHTAQAGQGQMLFALDWQIDDSVPIDTYSVSIKFWNEGPLQVAQLDFGLPYPRSRWQLVPMETSSLSPGDYELRLEVYNWKTGEGLIGRRGAAVGHALSIETVTVLAET